LDCIEAPVEQFAVAAALESHELNKKRVKNSKKSYTKNIKLFVLALLLNHASILKAKNDTDEIHQTLFHQI